MKFTATSLPTSQTYSVSEMQTVINDLLNKINQVADGQYVPGTTPLPQATSSTLGAVKVGANILLAEDGTISVTAPLSGMTNAVQASGIIIPLYIYPANIWTNTAYNEIVTLAKTYKRVPVICIINPSNGPGDPSVGVDGNYTVAINILHGAGIKVIGYVHSSYTGIPLSTVEQVVATWQKMYPAIDGIFCDESTYANDPASLLYYQNLNAYIKSLGFSYTILNPGAPFAGQYQSSDCADIIIGWESSVIPTLTQMQEDWMGGAVEYSVYKRGCLLYGQSTLDTSLLQRLAMYYGWVYITSDVLPNPWDTLPSYLSTLFSTMTTF